MVNQPSTFQGEGPTRWYAGGWTPKASIPFYRLSLVPWIKWMMVWVSGKKKSGVWNRDVDWDCTATRREEVKGKGTYVVAVMHLSHKKAHSHFTHHLYFILGSCDSFFQYTNYCLAIAWRLLGINRHSWIFPTRPIGHTCSSLHNVLASTHLLSSVDV